MNEFFKTTSKETQIEAVGHLFLCIYGTHANGGYIAIMNYGVCAELCDDWNDIYYNEDAIATALLKTDLSEEGAFMAAQIIAETIKDIEAQEVK